MELTECILRRRSGRNYNGAPIPEASFRKILEAGLLTPSGRNLKPTELITVTGQAELEGLAAVKAAGAAMLKTADRAIVVIGNAALSDTWIEDGSIAMTQMMLRATELGIANCWVQCRCRSTALDTPDGKMTSEAYAKQLLNIPENYGVLAILALGMSDTAPACRTADDADFSKVHRQCF